MPNYTIEARSLNIAEGVAGHDFWVLRDERGTAIAELHGLATDRQTGQAIPVGTDEDRHSLRVWHYAHDAGYAKSIGASVDRTTYIQDGQPARTVLSASRDEVLARWNAAVAAAPALNALDLDYPNYGFNIFSDTVNSNSTYRTLGEIMGVQVRDFGGRMEPGIDNRMVSPERIEQFRTHGYPVLDEPRIDAENKQVDRAALSPRDQAYFDVMRGKLPAEVPDGAVLDGVLRARQAGISLESFRDVAFVGDKAYVLGHTPGFRAEIDLAAAPSMEDALGRLSSLPAPVAEMDPVSQQRTGPSLA